MYVRDRFGLFSREIALEPTSQANVQWAGVYLQNGANKLSATWRDSPDCLVQRPRLLSVKLNLKGRHPQNTGHSLRPTSEQT